MAKKTRAMFTGKLDSYQIPAVEKFLSRGNSLCAFSMGLGKTPIAISAAEELLSSGKISRCLIVCPASLKYQWASRIAQFTDCGTENKKVGKELITVPPSSFCVLVDGDRKKREESYANLGSAKYIIIGYDNILVDYSSVSSIRADMVVLDEATAIKSFKAQRSKRIKKLLKVPYRLALTGTPIENRPDELFSIMQWVDDKCLGRYDLFDKAYVNRNKMGWVESYKNLHILRKRLEPAVSRLTDTDKTVKDFMPETNEKIWYASMTPEIENVYRLIAKDMLDEMSRQSVFDGFDVADFYMGIDESSPSGKLMGMYLCLELLVNHPDLIIWSGMQYESDKKGGSKYAFNLWKSGMVDDVLESPKLNLLLPMINKDVSSDKILVFSKYKYMIQIIQDSLGDYGSVQFHGGMSPVKKAEAVAKFTNNPDCRFFLSSHAGAYGMDMYMSNLLINYDLPWSAGKADQINYRHKRRSSNFDTVHVRNIIVAGSFEERRLRILERKRNLGSAVLDGKGGGKIILSGDSLKDHLTATARL